jgi:hypothetical protein
MPFGIYMITGSNGDLIPESNFELPSINLYSPAEAMPLRELKQKKERMNETAMKSHFKLDKKIKVLDRFMGPRLFVVKRSVKKKRELLKRRALNHSGSQDLKI